MRGDAEVAGQLIHTSGGPRLELTDLATRSTRTIADLSSYSRGIGRIGGLYRGSIVLAHQDTSLDRYVGIVDMNGSDFRRLWRGQEPTVIRHDNSIVFCADGFGGDSLIPILLGHVDSPSQMDTLGWTHVETAGFLAGWPARPVEMDSGWVAVVGPDAAIWKVNVQTRVWRRIGREAWWPRLWSSRLRTLVCWPVMSQRTMILHVDDGRTEEVKGFKRMSAIAPAAGTDSCLVKTPGPPIPGRDSWEVWVYDWRTRRPGGIVLRDFNFADGAIWIRD